MTAPANPAALVRALRAGIDALFTLEQFEHALILTGELFNVLSTFVSPAVASRDTMPAPSDLVMTTPAATAAPERSAGAQRQARYRERQRECAGSSRQLSLEGVTGRHADPISAVTRDVTRDAGDVTRNASVSVCPSPSEPPSGGGSEGREERDLSRAPRRALERPLQLGDVVRDVTRDAVTVRVTPPTELDSGLREIFDSELAKRPGVSFDAGWLWAKFVRHGFELRSRGHMENLWARWCQMERPAQVPLFRPPPAAPKEEAMPGPRAVAPSAEERSRRIAAERQQREAREREDFKRRLPELQAGAASLLAAVGVEPPRRREQESLCG